GTRPPPPSPAPAPAPGAAPAPQPAPAAPAMMAGGQRPPLGAATGARGVLPPSHPLMLMGRAESAKRLAVRMAPPPAAPPAPAAYNQLAILKVMQKSQGKCGLLQVAPGTYARLDCEKYEPISFAKTVSGKAKSDLFKAGGLRLDPNDPSAV